MSSFFIKLRRVSWWVGIPLLTLCSVFVPYWIWNLVNNVSPFWRIQIFQGAMFDITWYMPLIGGAISGYDAGGFLHWFKWVIVGLSKLMPNASIPEIWFVSRWIFTTLLVLISPWCFRRWAPLSLAASRFFAVSFWFALVLVMGMRPGIYSWWLPFCFVGLTFVRMAYDELEADSSYRAVLLSLAALPLAWLYTWFLIFTVIWLAAIWTAWLLKRHPRLLAVKLGGAIIIAVAAAVPLARYLSLPEQFAVVQMFERIGLAWTHMPYLTNSFLIVPGWILLLVAFSKMRKMDERAERVIVPLQFAWFALLLAWQFSVFVGVALQNDHFRSPVILMSWIGFAVLWQALRGSSGFSPSSSIFIYKFILLGLFLVGLVFIYRNIASSYVFHDEYLNVLHLSHWFLLALAAWCVLRYASGSRPFLSRSIAGLLFAVSFLGGVSASFHVHRNELIKLPEAMKQLPLMNYLRSNVPVGHAVCSDPVTAAFFGIHIARLPHPTVITKFRPETDAKVLGKLVALAGEYDVAGAGYTKSFKRFVRMDRYVPCVSYEKSNKIMRFMGFDAATIDRLNGCPREMLDEEQRIFQAALDNRQRDDETFRKFCPWVVIPDSQKQFWRLPVGYNEARPSEGVSVWSPYLNL